MAPPLVGVVAGDAEEDRAEHEEDQRERRDQDEDDLLGDARQRLDRQETVDRGQGEGHADRRQHADDDRLVRCRVGFVIVADVPADGGRDCGGDDQGANAALAVLVLEAACFEGKRRAAARLDHRHQHDVTDVQTGEHQTRHEGAGVHGADRAAELVGHDDQHQRGRNDLRQGARGGNNAGGEPAVVAVAQHDRQRDQAHRDHRGSDDAGGRGQQRADEDHRVGQAAANRPEQLANRVEQVFGHARTFEDEAHEGEERDRQQGVVGHDAKDAVRQGLQEARLEQAHADADDREHEAVCGQGKRDRVTGKQEDHQGAEHDRGHRVADDRHEEF
jgi:hypothetical protein